MSSTFHNKKVPMNKLKDIQIMSLQDEVKTLENKIKWLEEELEEEKDVVYRLTHGLPVEWEI